MLALEDDEERPQTREERILLEEMVPIILPPAPLEEKKRAPQPLAR